MKKVITYIIVLLLFCVLILVGDTILFEAQTPEVSYIIPRQIQYSFTVQNKTGRLMKNAEFWTYAPVKQTATQRCMKLEVSHSYELSIDDLGNQILHFTFNDFPPFATKIVTIKADLLLAEKPNPSLEQDIKDYLGESPYCESQDSQIQGLARDLRVSDPLKTVENIYAWVAGNVEYAGYLKHTRGARYAINNKKGDCTEFMYLFAALCRAGDIPARGIGGYVCDGNAVFRPNDYHNWAEFYHDGAWRLSDPQRKVFRQNPSQYIAMQIIDSSTKNPMGEYHRFRFAGDGFKVKMNG